MGGAYDSDITYDHESVSHIESFINVNGYAPLIAGLDGPDASDSRFKLLEKTHPRYHVFLMARIPSLILVHPNFSPCQDFLPAMSIYLFYEIGYLYTLIRDKLPATLHHYLACFIPVVLRDAWFELPSVGHLYQLRF